MEIKTQLEIDQMPLVRRKWRCRKCMEIQSSVKKKNCKKCGGKTLHARKNLMNSVREQILDKYGWKCVYCGVTVKRGVQWWFHPEEFSIDHIVPLSRGGNDKESNLILSCRSCNASKGNSKTIKTDKKIRLEGRKIVLA